MSAHKRIKQHQNTISRKNYDSMMKAWEIYIFALILKWCHAWLHIVRQDSELGCKRSWSETQPAIWWRGLCQLNKEDTQHRRSPAETGDERWMVFAWRLQALPSFLIARDSISRESINTWISDATFLIHDILWASKTLHWLGSAWIHRHRLLLTYLWSRVIRLALTSG